MRFDRITLENFKCYADADVRLDRGVTVIHGLNGSGKSSLLEACFFTLYGARALDRTLEAVVTKGAEEAVADLAFTHDGAAYRVHRRVRVTDDRATTAECLLETPDDTVEGARDVADYVTDLLRMDAEAFVNCAYVRQGEVNKLINASPGERQDMIDALLQLGTLEEYRERAGDARLGVEDLLSERQSLLADREEQIEAKEDADLYGRRDALRSELGEIAEEVERIEDQREAARETLSDAEEVLERHAERREELDDVTADVEALTDTIAEDEAEREELAAEIDGRHDRLAELDETVAEALAETDVDADDGDVIDERLSTVEAELDGVTEDVREVERSAQALENQSSNLAERADDLESRAAEERETAADLDASVEEGESLVADLRETLADVESEIDRLRERFSNAPIDAGEAEDLLAERRDAVEDLRERQQSVAADCNAAERRVAEAEALLDAGKCPECGQPVDGSPHVDSAEEDRERAAELRDRLEALEAEREEAAAAVEAAEALVDAESELERKRDRRAELDARVEERSDALGATREDATEHRQRAEEFESEAAEKRAVAEEKAAEAETERDRVDELEAERASLRAERDALRDAAAAREERAEVESEIDRRRERRASLADLNDERRDRLSALRERADELRELVDEDAVAEARSERERAEGYLEEAEAELEGLRERRDELQGDVGAVERELEELERLREERADLAARVAELEAVHGEVSTLEETYGDLRAELRQQNVARLEALLNETFELVYGNDSYSRIELSGRYELTVYQKDGETLAPDQLSGGERALFNLSLRTAIYRLLAEGIDGAAPMPPLILDEPTVFLDAGHVSRLVELVESMRDHGVEQIVVVSHDDELVDAADDVVHVEKDPTTNRSTVERLAATL